MIGWLTVNDFLGKIKVNTVFSYSRFLIILQNIEVNEISRSKYS